MPLGRRRHDPVRGGCDRFGLQLLKRQLQLLDLPVKLLGGVPELHMPQLGELRAQRLDQQIAAVKLGTGVGESGFAFGEQRF